MFDFLHTCLATRIAPANRNHFSSLGCGREAVARLAIALAIIVLVFGSLGLGAGGAEQDLRIAHHAATLR